MIQGNQFLFKIDISHSYFESSKCTCLQFIAGNATQLLKKRFDFTIQNEQSGFSFYTSSNNSLKEYLAYITTVTNKTYFDFDVITRTQLFWIFTELPENCIGQLFFDSASGIYDREKKNILLKQELSNEKSFKKIGSIKINFEDIIKYYTNHTGIYFEIKFEARSTQWNYYIINKSNMKLDSLAITEKTTAFSFEGPESVVIEDGTNAMKFSSGKNLIPLSQVPAYKFDLVNNPKEKTSSSKLILKGLPNPDSEKIDFFQVNGKNRIASPMYIYI